MIQMLCVGDPHFQTKNLVQAQAFVAWLVHLVQLRSDEVDAVVLMGDLLHTHERLHSAPLTVACDLVLRLAAILPTYVLVGNHDFINNSQFLSENHWMNCLKGSRDVHIVDRVTVSRIQDVDVAFVPYVFPGRFREALLTQFDSFESFRSTVSCVFAHQEFRNAKMGCFLSEEGDVWDDFDPMVISGHIHQRQDLQPNIHYTGSCLQHAYGEPSDKTISLVSIPSVETNNSLSTKIELLPVPGRKKAIIQVGIEEFRSRDWTCVIKDKNKIDYRLCITGEKHEFPSLSRHKTFKKIVNLPHVQIVTRENHQPRWNLRQELNSGEQGADGGGGEQNQEPGQLTVFTILQEKVAATNDPALLSLFAQMMTTSGETENINSGTRTPNRLPDL